MMRKMHTITERDINMIRWGYELLIVTNADIDVVKKAIDLASEIDNGINEICDILNSLGYFATWENFNDMRLEIKE